MTNSRATALPSPGARFLAATGSLAEEISISDDSELTDEEIEQLFDETA